MNKFIAALATSAIAASAFAGPTAPSGKTVAPQVTPAADDDIGATLAVGYDTDFYFRGLMIAEDWVSTSLNFSTEVAEGTSLNLGANYGSVYDSGFDYDRLVLNAGVSRDLGFANASLGYRYYSHDGFLGGAFEDTSEIYLNLTKSVGIINFGLSTNYDVTNEAWYFELGANTEIKLTDRISLVPGASIGYGVDYNYQIPLFSFFGAEVNGFTAATVSLAAPIKLSSRATLTPYIAGNLPVDELDGFDNEVYGGVSLSVKF
jgi:hypothetical protein